MVGALVAMSVLLAIAVLHVYWALGGEAGKAAAIPERDGRPVIRPSAAGTFVVACVIAAAAFLLALRIGLVDWPALRPVVNVMTWLLAAVFAVRAIGDFRYVGFFKSVRNTKFARLDTHYYSPLCGILALLIGNAARI